MAFDLKLIVSLVCGMCVSLVFGMLCVSHWSVGCVSSEQVLTGKVFEAYHVTGPLWGTSSMSLVHMG